MKEYTRNNCRAFLDPIRNKLLIATPEEEVRVKFLYFLINYIRFPKDKLDTEVPLSYYVKGAIGRTDILGYHYCEENKYNIPLFLVECKAPGVPITERVLSQALGYDSVLKVQWIFLTNGVETAAFQFNLSEEKFNLVKGFPTYEQMHSSVLLPLNDEPSVYDYKRPKFENVLSEKNKEQAAFFGWLGKGSPVINHGYLLNLAGLLYDLNDAMELPISTPWFEILEDGYRYTTFGNAAGGGWTGDYRYFLIRDHQGQNQIISLGIMGKVFGDENPKFPNSNGHTTLIVAVDDFEKSHNSLQMDLDKYVVRTADSIELWHDGTITAGKKGRLRNSVVIDYIKKRDHTLLKNGKIYLGKLPANRNIVWKDAEQFIINCIKYGLFRDEVRNNYFRSS
ncbi:type I restriction enzyme HsdR N-terminal domain-containing protein [Pontibacter sp. MBLB2868]|uniref:type I restriction enzyme HsdR N-terminal domain-containing protein n=1 Tax=Pontibacter sp. MBLB2868 TaxID=3451555 RepID=UPI003F74FCEB